MKKICFLIALIIAVTACGNPTTVPLKMTAQIDVPEDPSKPEAGRFLPIDSPFKTHFVLTKTGDLPENLHLSLRVIDMRDIEYQHMSWSLPELPQGETSLTRIVEIVNLPGSRKVHLQMALTGPDDTVYTTQSTETTTWQTIVTGYALYNSLNFSKGWHSLDAPDIAESPVSRWCKGSGYVHFSRPLFPMMLELDGLSLPRCFPEKQWTFKADLNGQIVTEDLLTEEKFSYRFYIPDVRTSLSSHPGVQAWPTGEMELILSGDQNFVPAECSNGSDKRNLSFHVGDLKLVPMVLEKGFYTPEKEDGHYWPAPDFTVRLPDPTDQTELFIQGIRKIDCIEMPQTISVTVDGVELPGIVVSDQSFCLSWPIKELLNEADEHLVRVTVSPVFFRAQCMETEDNRPYGIGLQEICVR